MSTGDDLRPLAATSPNSHTDSDNFRRAELIYWREPAGKRICHLLELCQAAPTDDHWDELRAEFSKRHNKGELLDSPAMQELIAKTERAAFVCLARYKRGWSIRWLFDLCEKYLRNLDSLEAAFSGRPERWSILEGRGTGLDRADDFNAFWDIARFVAGVRPIPDYPTQDKKLSLSAVRNEVRRLQNWCATLIPFADFPPANDASGERTVKRKRKGRKPTDQKGDARLWDAWNTGHHADYSALARAFKMKVADVKKALDRTRKRRKKSAG